MSLLLENFSVPLMNCYHHWNILYIDIVNPYIKSLGSTDIMSSVEDKTSTVSPDQGASGGTSTSIQLMEAGETPKKDTEAGKTEVYHKRILIFLLVLLSVLFIIITIMGIIGIISVL